MRLHSLFLCSIGAEKHQGLGKTLSIKKEAVSNKLEIAFFVSAKKSGKS